MNKQIIINGVGGQGIIFITKILSLVCLNKNYNVKISETYGMAQRGGSVISFLKIGNFNSPMIIPKDGDILICMHKDELENGKYYLKENGKIYLNSDDYFNATELALKYSSPTMANVIFLGYISKDKDFPFKYEEIYEVLPEKSKKFFNLGYSQ